VEVAVQSNQQQMLAEMKLSCFCKLHKYLLVGEINLGILSLYFLRPASLLNFLKISVVAK
jgi:hypothetical protein